jgi:hypothetical protein
MKKAFYQPLSNPQSALQQHPPVRIRCPPGCPRGMHWFVLDRPVEAEQDPIDRLIRALPEGETSKPAGSAHLWPGDRREPACERRLIL